MRRWVDEINRPTFVWRHRDGWLLAVGVLVFVLIFNGPPISHLGGADLRFGLSGPLAATPWHWGAALMLILLVLSGERRPLGSMLLTRPSAKDIEWALIAFGCSMAWTWIATSIWPQRASGGESQIVALGVAGVLVLIVTAAVTEEIVFRGYLSERLGALTRSRWAGAAISLAIFVVPHVAFFGPIWLLHHLAGTVAIIAVVLARRNLWAGMLVHLCRNLPILIPTISAG